MALDDRHPAYLMRVTDWELLADCYEGERRVKERGDRYLPPTSAMIANGYPTMSLDGRSSGQIDSIGKKAYDAYLVRAVFPEFLREAIIGMVGIIHRKPPKITVPKVLEKMLESATITGESIELLWRRITEEQLLYGRCGMLVDVPDGETIADSMPYVALYKAPAIINWDAGQRRQGRSVLELVVLDETEVERQENLSWRVVRQLRICTLASAATTEMQHDQEAVADGQYVVILAREDTEGGFGTLASHPQISPRLGGTTLEQVPFVFLNVNDVIAEPDRPPLLGLARLSLAVYRGEADYRQSLFMQGQDTLVRIGATEEQQLVMTGVGAILDLPMNGDAKYIGVSSQGLPEQRSSLENDRAAASRYAVQLLDAKGDQAESGEALRVRVSARTATLLSIQNAAAEAIRDVLRHAGRWLGLGDAELDSIEVVPNRDFSDAKADPAAVLALAQAKQIPGFPLAWESFHAWLKENEYTMLEFSEENEKIAEEKTDIPEGGTNVDLLGGGGGGPPTPGGGGFPGAR